MTAPQAPALAITPTATTATPTGPDTGSEAGPQKGATTSGRERLRRLRWPAAALAALLVPVVVGVLSARTGGQGYLAPDSDAPDGARALVQVLADRGVAVREVTSHDELEAALDGGDTTVVVARPDLLLAPRDTDLAGAVEDSSADLVLVAPDAAVLDALGLPLRDTAEVELAETAPDCTDSDASAAGRADAGGVLYEAQDVPAGTTVVTCYPDRPGADSRGASYAVVDDGGRRTTVLGQPALVSNDRLADGGNAALAVRALGANPTLVWYTPSPTDLPEDSRPSLLSLLPSWVPWATAQLLVALALAVLWRGRRLGRVVPEPLPVVVRAAETTEGRARLYRRVGARDRAAAVLRAAAVRRLAERTGLPGGSAATDVVAVVAQHTGRPAADIDALLRGGPPADDDSLVRLARALDALETEVRRP